MRQTFAALFAVAVLAIALPAAALPSCSCSYCETHEFDQCWSFESGSTTFCFFYLEQYCGWGPGGFTADLDQPLLLADCAEASVQPAVEATDEPDLDRFLAELAAG